METMASLIIREMHKLRDDKKLMEASKVCSINYTTLWRMCNNISGATIEVAHRLEREGYINPRAMVEKKGRVPKEYFTKGLTKDEEMRTLSRLPSNATDVSYSRGIEGLEVIFKSNGIEQKTFIRRRLSGRENVKIEKGQNK